MPEYICQISGKRYSSQEIRWKSEHNGLLDLDFSPKIDLDVLKTRPFNLWRYRESLPIEDAASIISFQEGFTPLVEVEIAGRSVALKLDFLFPSGSYKDRGASILMSQVKALGLDKVVQDSSGNAGCAVAAYAAKAGITCKILVPAATSEGKLAQISLYGAQLDKVPGSREATARAAQWEAEKIYYASHVWNPYFHHGTKTFAYEVCEQLSWQAPDTVVLPAGNGTLLIGVYIGFKELMEAGIITHFPKLIGVQSAHCAPLYEAFLAGKNTAKEFQKKATLAEGISIAHPQRGAQMLAQVRESKGRFLAVEEGEIVESLREMAQMGYYIEPTSAAVIAGLKQYVHHYAEKEEKIVSVMTGNGLKSTEKMLKILN
ncbi:MAG: threonine synthase [Bacteroidota bacterium]